MVEKQFFPGKENLSIIRDFISDAMRCAELEMNFSRKILICADEILSNIIFYSGADFVTVQCKITKKQAELIFIDNGKSFNPLENSSEPNVTASIEERKTGGLGIFLVKKMMNFANYQRKDNTNIFSTGLYRS